LISMSRHITADARVDIGMPYTTLQPGQQYEVFGKF
jgi:hypothetical protein